MMTKQSPEPQWIEQVRSRGWQNALIVALDVVEPLGPLAAQLLWVAQPAAGLFGAQRAVHDIAQALEEPGGLEDLRQQLWGDDRG